MEEGLGVAADERQRRAQLVADRRDEPLAQLLEGPDRAEVAQDRGRPGRRGRMTPAPAAYDAGDPDRRAGTAPNRGLAICDRTSRGADLGEWAVLRAVTAGHLATQDVGARSAHSSGGRRPKEPLARRVEADDPILGVDLEDEIGGAVDDGPELVPFAFQRLAQPCSGERDRELVASEEGDPKAVVVERSARLRPHSEEHLGVGLREGDRAAARDRRRSRSAPRRGRRAGLVRRRASVAALGGDPVEAGLWGWLQVEGRTGRARQAHQLERAPRRRAGPRSRPRRRAGSAGTGRRWRPPRAGRLRKRVAARSRAARPGRAVGRPRRVPPRSGWSTAVRDQRWLSARPGRAGARRTPRPDRGARQSARRDARRGRDAPRGPVWSGHPSRPRTDGERVGLGERPTILLGGLEGRGCGRQRIEDGLVADRAATPARQPVGGGAQHPRRRRTIQGEGVVRPRRRFQKRRAVERPGRATHGRHEPVPDGPQQLARGCLAGSSASSASTARKPMTRLSPWSPSPRTVSRRVR